MTQTTDSMAAEIVAQNAATSDFYKSLTDRGIDPHAPAGPGVDDLLEMGIVACQDCGIHVEVESAHTACTDGASGTCGDCHDAACSDRSCRDGS